MTLTSHDMIKNILLSIVEQDGMFYRIDDELAAGFVIVSKYKIIKETPCFYIIKNMNSFNNTRRMLKNARRPFAHKTLDEAANAYMRRKFRHIEHLNRNLKKITYIYKEFAKAVNKEAVMPPEEWFNEHSLWENDY